MKRIMKKNQIVITGLAVMIAIAGYLNFSGTDMELESSPTSVQDDSVLLETEEENAAASNTGVLVDVESLDGEEEIDTASSDNPEGIPGEAVLTSAGTNSGFAAEARLTREQIRAKNKETLLEVINNEEISAEEKEKAVTSMNAMADIAEREAAAELLLEAKGFADSVVSITEGTADVVINMTEISDAQRAQIEDIVKRKTEISGENIVITPISQ
ncbi:MAG: SpoIIIAH-like family protein [Eubacteriales bacterium]|nr:SpoIIIAH-like family protein [Eubacteriales bacterium]